MLIQSIGNMDVLNCITYIEQSTFLFNDTIFENIILGNKNISLGVVRFTLAELGLCMIFQFFPEEMAQQTVKLLNMGQWNAVYVVDWNVDFLWAALLSGLIENIILFALVYNSIKKRDFT